MRPTSFLRINLLASAIASMVAMCLLPSAHAAGAPLVSTDFSLTNITYELINLDPLSTVTPWVKFSTITQFNGATSGPSTGIGPLTSLTQTTADGFGTATVGQGAFVARTSVAASAVPGLGVTSAGVSPSSYMNIAATSDPATGNIFNVTLSANTELIIKGYASIKKSIDLKDLQTLMANNNINSLSVSAGAGGGILMNLAGANTASSTYSVNGPAMSIYGSLTRDAQTSTLPITQSYDSGLQSFSVQWSNTLATQQIGSLYLSLSSSGYLYTSSPTPEPTTYVLMGLGLATANLVARRRSKT
jgi:hypothetical protein